MILTIIGWFLAALYTASILFSLFSPLRRNRKDETAQERAWGLTTAILALVFVLAMVLHR